MKIINTPAFSVSISVDENGNIIDSKTSIMYNPIEQKQETLEETCDRLFPTAAIEREIVKENQQKDKLAIEFGEWLCKKAKVSYIKGTMGGTLEIFKKEKGII